MFVNEEKAETPLGVVIVSAGERVVPGQLGLPHTGTAHHTLECSEKQCVTEISVAIY